MLPFRHNCVSMSQDKTFPFTLSRVWCSPAQCEPAAPRVLAALCPGEQQPRDTFLLTSTAQAQPSCPKLPSQVTQTLYLHKRALIGTPTTHFPQGSRWVHRSERIHHHPWHVRWPLSGQSSKKCRSHAQVGIKNRIYSKHLWVQTKQLD